MANESLTRNEEIVDGIYPLGALVARSIGGAIYETEFSESGEAAFPAVIRIREVEPEEAENLSRRFRSLAHLAHPNLLKIYATGSSLLNGVPIFYVVMERADESLGAVLSERALTGSETREMLEPTLKALGYLHEKGYAHSRLRPSNVLAVGDQLKLSADSVIRVNEWSDADATDDMRALGVLIVQALARKVPNPDGHRETHDFDGIPQPLADIVRHCLEPDRTTRWTVEQVKARLNAPAIMEEKWTRPEKVPDAPTSRKEIAKWAYAGLAVLILIVILASVLRRSDSATVPTPAVAATQHDVEATGTDSPVAEAAAPRAELPQAEAPKASSPHAVAPVGERKSSGWSVIVGAYRSRTLAEKRMHELSKRWPKFEISVVESQTEKSQYQVILGRNLGEDQAQALRQRAVKSGLPRDTYIKRAM